MMDLPKCDELDSMERKQILEVLRRDHQIRTIDYKRISGLRSTKEQLSNFTSNLNSCFSCRAPSSQNCPTCQSPSCKNCFQENAFCGFCKITRDLNTKLFINEIFEKTTKTFDYMIEALSPKHIEIEREKEIETNKPNDQTDIESIAINSNFSEDKENKSSTDKNTLTNQQHCFHQNDSDYAVQPNNSFLSIPINQNFQLNHRTQLSKDSLSTEKSDSDKDVQIRPRSNSLNPQSGEYDANMDNRLNLRRNTFIENLPGRQNNFLKPNEFESSYLSNGRRASELLLNNNSHTKDISANFPTFNKAESIELVENSSKVSVIDRDAPTKLNMPKTDCKQPVINANYKPIIKKSNLSSQDPQREPVAPMRWNKKHSLPDTKLSTVFKKDTSISKMNNAEHIAKSVCKVNLLQTDEEQPSVYNLDDDFKTDLNSNEKYENQSRYHEAASLNHERQTLSLCSPQNHDAKATRRKSVSENIMHIFRSPKSKNEASFGDIFLGIYYDKLLSNLMVNIVQCRNLVPLTNTVHINAYVKVYTIGNDLSSLKNKTKTKKNSTNPIFDEILKFKINQLAVDGCKVIVSVWNQDWVSRNQFLGHVEVLFDVSADTYPAWHHLTSWKEHEYFRKMSVAAIPSCGSPRGQISLELKYVGVAQEGSGRGEHTAGELYVMLKEGKIIDISVSKNISLFCKCRLLPLKTSEGVRLSQAWTESTQPRWNCLFIFHQMSCDDLWESSLELIIYNKSNFNKQRVGTLRLNVDSGTSFGQRAEWMETGEAEKKLWMQMLEFHDQWNCAELYIR